MSRRSAATPTAAWPNASLRRLPVVFNFTRGETAVMCVFLLRRPPTPGKLQSRTERIHRFEELGAVALHPQPPHAQREPSLVTSLPRRPGTKEIRYMHLLSGETEALANRTADSGTPHRAARDLSGDERLRQVEAEVASLRQEVMELKQQIEAILSNQP